MNESGIQGLLLESSDEEDAVIIDFSDDDEDTDPDFVPEISSKINALYENLDSLYASSDEDQFTENIQQIENAPKNKKINKGTLQINDESNILKIPFPTLTGKDGCIWQTSKPPTKSKTTKKNIIHIRPGPTDAARMASSPKECLQLFISDDIMEIILLRTNEEIKIRREKYKTQISTVSETTITELYALIGLLILSAATKSNHLNTDLLFNSGYCGIRYKSTMSENRFKFLLTCLRFDNKATRDERRKQTKFAPISEIFEILINNCKRNYRPSSYVTIDEQLVGFRGQCPFKMFLPSKPDKYGLKLVNMCDNASSYMINALPYLGRGTVPENTPAGAFFVKSLVEPLKGTNRNVTTDNWFTSIPLAEELLSDYKLTTVGTIRRNKKEFPTQFIDPKFNQRQIQSSMFLYKDDLTAVSFKTKANTVVLLISTMHDEGIVNFNSKKPEIILTYNSTKGSVDTFDQMCNLMSCNRKTRRWPLCIFYNMLNIACINAYVIYVHNLCKNSPNSKPLSRQKFMLQLHEELTDTFLTTRLLNPKLRTSLKRNINECLKTDGASSSNSNNQNSNQSSSRKYCSNCNYQKRRYTTTFCSNCNIPICGEHQIKCCASCFEYMTNNI